MKNGKWRPAQPSKTCETWVNGRQECGRPAVMAYPAMGGGYMALCAEHGEKHASYCVTIEQARLGLAPELHRDRR